jgi:Zn finger protein HypA/HybF involved in hydrogenase expression
MSAPKPKVIKCVKCGKRLRNIHEPWNVELKNGKVQWYICPDCQSPEQNVEAEINEATLHYGTLPDGRIIGFPKEG